jgi:murein DD-endopeptidase MepM/ murein hydrolase activator NlpD
MATIPKLNCPVANCVLGGYKFGASWQWGSCGGRPKKHTGVDLSASVGASVVAPEDGIILHIYSAGANWAQAILIEHIDEMGETYITQLMHVDPFGGIKKMDNVTRGQQVATIAGINTPHLHFGVWNGPYVAPTAHRGALPDVPADQTCSDGTYTDPGFPANFVDPMPYL